jgi:hypothetical protein
MPEYSPRGETPWWSRLPASTNVRIPILSLSARIAIALLLFRDYCNHRDLYHAEIDRFADYLWDFIALPSDGSMFDQWVQREPLLVAVGLGDDFPLEFNDLLNTANVSIDEFRQVLGCTTEVLFSSMYAAADETGSRQYLLELAQITESVGGKWPDLNCFIESRWSDRHGWGMPLSEQELVRWRHSG